MVIVFTGESLFNRENRRAPASNRETAKTIIHPTKAGAVIYSLMLTCRACGIEPLAWLRDAQTELPQRTENADITDLLPFNFQKTAAA